MRGRRRYAHHIPPTTRILRCVQSSKASRIAKFTAIHLVIIIAFLALLYGAYHATSHSTSLPPPAHIAQHLSNGTHIFAPTTLLISLDGFRADFLTRNLTPTLNSFIREGVSPKYMLPSFPSLTFPNHFTLVTGLHPESHGVVGNTFWDPDTMKEFYYTDPERSMQPEWWKAEPLWLTAELQGVRTAIHMWPGSEAHIGSMEPAYVDEFKVDEVLSRKVERIFHWLDLPGPEEAGVKADDARPQFIAAYVPNVDSDGHMYGPNSTYIRSTIAEVDGMLADIFAGIDERNLTDIVNIIVVSDHGMATTSTQRLIQLEDLIDTSLIEHTDGWPLYGLRPYDNSEKNIMELYNGLSAMTNLPKYRDAFDVYLRDQNMPKRFHFSNNHRIAPLWIMPRAGWAVVTRDEFDVIEGQKEGLVYHPRGLHGYDHEHPLMRAIFVARGPAFPHPKGSRIAEFQNTEVYNIVCDSLGLTPVANNGTLRLPFRTQGTHDFDEAVEIPHDPQEDELPEVPNLANRPTPAQGFPTLPAGSQLPPIPPLQPIPPEEVDETVKPDAPKRPVVHDGLDEEDEAPKGLKLWWEWVKGKLDALKWWAQEQAKGNEKDGEKKGGSAR
jgi:predicted AlkP superfamily pyrophosphatase or phosphodiesterase